MDIFTNVFSSAYDSDLTDGDDSDYHLFDQGTNTNTEVYGNVSEDFEGDSRPPGADFDRGADEAR